MWHGRLLLESLTNLEDQAHAKIDDTGGLLIKKYDQKQFLTQRNSKFKKIVEVYLSTLYKKNSFHISFKFKLRKFRNYAMQR